MLKIIIYLPGINSAHQPPMGRYLRSQKHDKHIWDGKEYDLNDPLDVVAFNNNVKAALAAYPHYPARPLPLVFEEEPEAAHVEPEGPAAAEVQAPEYAPAEKAQEARENKPAPKRPSRGKKPVGH
jgi:hypothetical protein